MSPMYTVKQGDYLAKIAKAHGLADWRRIYNDPQNASFREKRPDPDLLFPGDQLFIPDKKLQETTCHTENKYTFTIQRPKYEIQMTMRDEEGSPIPLLKYELKTNMKTYQRHIEDGPEIKSHLQAGLIHETIDTEEESGQLKVWLKDGDDEPDFQTEIKVGHLDPVEEITGLQGRLNNLGYDCGNVDGTLGPKTANALKQYQTDHHLAVTGKADAATMAALTAQYGA